MNNFYSNFSRFIAIVFTVTCLSLEANAVTSKQSDPSTSLNNSVKVIHTKYISDFGDSFYSDFDSLRRNFFSNYNDFYSNSFSLNVYENDKTFYVDAELAGVNKEDINLTMADNVLTIKVSKNDSREKEEEAKTKTKYYLKEHSSGTYERSIGLPNYLNNESIVTSFKNSILKIEIQKKEVAQPKKIEIK